MARTAIEAGRDMSTAPATQKGTCAARMSESEAEWDEVRGMGERGESGAVISGVAGLRQAVLTPHVPPPHGPWDLGNGGHRRSVRRPMA